MRFGAFDLDAANEELRRSGVRIKLQAQPLRVLHLLAGRAGELVTREEIQEHVWGAETHVESEQGINVCIGQIRRALGDQASAPRFVETVPRRGYRFVAPVERPAERTSPAVAPTPRPAPRRIALGWWAAGGAGGLVLTALVLSWMVSGEAATPSPRTPWPAPDPSAAAKAGPPAAGQVPRLMVLPFQSLGAGEEGEHLAAGLTEEVITELVRGYGGRLGVIARTTSWKYEDTTMSVAEIASELGVDWVLEGSVRRDGGRVRVTAQLIGDDDLHRWANEYDREPERARLPDLDLQSTVSETIARAVALNLGLVEEAGPPGAPLASASSSHVAEAHESYLDGLSWLSRRKGADAARALIAFRRTVELDPGFAGGWLGVASALVAGGAPEVGTAGLSDRREEARMALERALDLDESLPDAHRRLALIRFYKDWDLEGARASWERALELAPHFSEAHHDFAAYWSVTGHHERALAEVRQALDFDPRSPGVISDVGWYSYFAGRPEEAADRCRETLAIDPGYFWAEECLLAAALATGDLSGARDQALAGLERRGAPSEIRAAVAQPDPARALEAFLCWDVEQIEAARRDGKPVVPAQLAVRLMMLGDGDGALGELERAADARLGWILPFLPVHPLFDPVRDSPRFEALVRRISGPPGLTLSSFARAERPKGL